MLANRSCLIICAAIVDLLVGCDKVQGDSSSENGDILDFRRMMHESFVDECRNVALGERYLNANSMRYNAQFKITYIDERYLSFYSDAWVDSEDYVHGGTSLIVGTIDRKTGTILKAADMIPSQRLAEVESLLRNDVAKKLKDYLLNEPQLIDNCYLSEDGLHFVYQEYQIAPFSLGPIEIVVDVPSDASRQVSVVKVITRSIDGSDPCRLDEE